MNKWECDHPQCTSEAHGNGGAMGLRAIGWYFRPGPVLFCPRHRPDPTPCVDKASEGCENEPCSSCTADQEAQYWQEKMDREYGLEPFRTRLSAEPKRASL
jgi:hypothetical protein